MFEAVEALATRYEEMKAQLGSEGQATVKAATFGYVVKKV